MAQKRSIMLAVALVVAAVAAVATWSYLGGVQDRAYGNAALTKVVVVKRDLKQGLSGDQAISERAVGLADIPRRFRPASALTDVSAIRGRVAMSDLAAGQVLVAGQFSNSNLVPGSFAERIPAGQVAITVQVDQIRGVANLVVPGDKVNILTHGPDGEHLLYQNVSVLAVGTTLASAPGDGNRASSAPASGTSSSGLITFAVPPAAAQKLALVSAGGADTGGLYLNLVRPDNQPVPAGVVNPGNLFQGGLTPYGP